MAAWSSICWVNNLWAAVSAAPCPAPPAGGKTPNPRRPGGIVPPRPGVGKGAGPGGLWPPERRPGPAQREPRAGPRQGASNETGRRPTTGRGPRRQPPANTNGGEGPRAGAGQGRAAAMGRGRPGRASTGPACTRPAAYISWPSPPPPGAGGPPPRGRPRPQGALRPRQRPGRGAPGRPHTEQGPSLPVVGRRRRQKKMAGRLAPRLDTTGRKKMRGGRFVPPACRHSGYQISPCSA